MKRFASLVILALSVSGISIAQPAAASCTDRMLVLSAMPVELGPILAQTSDVLPIVVGGHTFYAGTLAGGPSVILGLTGIGTENARVTTTLALDHFSCIKGIAFSGTSGGKAPSRIGDVVVPQRWTLDGEHFFDSDAGMLSSATASSQSVQLSGTAAVGDCACFGVSDPDAVKFVDLGYTPTTTIGGDGMSSDPFNNNALPCIPGGGDVFGCKPCKAPDLSASDVPRFANGAVPFLTPEFFLWYQQWSSGESAASDVNDMETAAVASVAFAHDRVPFIGFRALSDGDGDPLHLPGFPFQFFAYRQFAADNAAAVTMAFLRAWGTGS